MRPPPETLSSRLTQALRWSREARPAWPQSLTGALGMGVPIALGVALGHVNVGVAASLGGLAVSGVGSGDPSLRRPARLGVALLVGSAAAWVGATLAGGGVPAAVAVLAIAATAGLVGGFSRALAEAAGRFLLLVIITASVGRAGLRPLGMAFLFTVGAAWTALVSLALDGLLARGGGPAAASAPPRAVPWRRRTRAWWLSLRSFPGWQYTARITLSLAAAELVALAWGAHHGAWIVLTVALVVHRRPSASFDRAVQRGAGTVLGVLVGSLFLVGRPPLWGLVAAFAVLAGARPVLRAGNYAAYSAAMTPLVVLLMDFGRARPPSVLVDRLLATLAGCVLALVLGYAVWLPLLQAERPDAPRRPDPAGR